MDYFPNWILDLLRWNSKYFCHDRSFFKLKNVYFGQYLIISEKLKMNNINMIICNGPKCWIRDQAAKRYKRRTRWCCPLISLLFHYPISMSTFLLSWIIRLMHYLCKVLIVTRPGNHVMSWSHDNSSFILPETRYDDMTKCIHQLYPIKQPKTSSTNRVATSNLSEEGRFLYLS